MRLGTVQRAQPPAKIKHRAYQLVACGGIFLAGILPTSLSIAASGMFATKVAGFPLEKLPKGKNVTIPRPATTIVNLPERVTFTATDMPQSLSFRPISARGGVPRPVHLSIFDRGADRVQHADVQPGTPFLYNFKNLQPITVVVEGGSSSGRGLTLQVESDKPLEIAH